MRQPIVSGGFAVAHHGFIRGTVDIDVIAIESVKTEITALEAKGYKLESVQTPIGRIDLLSKANKGIDFIHLESEEFLKSLISRTVQGLILNEPVRMVSLEDLIVLQRLAVKGRKSVKDPIDLEQLEAKSFDRDYVDLWVSALSK